MPYQLARQTVEVRATPTTVEIFHHDKRVASHMRTAKPYTAVTDVEHRPAAHRAHLDWPPSRLVQWATTVGPRTQEVVETILEAQPHPEMGYRACLGIIRLGQRYPAARVEAAAARALVTGAVSYRSMDSILRHNLDQQPLNPPPAPRSVLEHDNIRGAAYIDPGSGRLKLSLGNCLAHPATHDQDRSKEFSREPIEPEKHMDM